jgi:hypothetical protein
MIDTTYAGVEAKRFPTLVAAMDWASQNMDNIGPPWYTERQGQGYVIRLCCAPNIWVRE